MRLSFDWSSADLPLTSQLLIWPLLTVVSQGLMNQGNILVVRRALAILASGYIAGWKAADSVTKTTKSFIIKHLWISRFFWIGR